LAIIKNLDLLGLVSGYLEHGVEKLSIYPEDVPFQFLRIILVVFSVILVDRLDFFGFDFRYLHCINLLSMLVIYTGHLAFDHFSDFTLLSSCKIESFSLLILQFRHKNLSIFWGVFLFFYWRFRKLQISFWMRLGLVLPMS
jgi:hypothetical protein